MAAFVLYFFNQVPTTVARSLYAFSAKDFQNSSQSDKQFFSIKQIFRILDNSTQYFFNFKKISRE
jgi:hypothetical protein